MMFVIVPLTEKICLRTAKSAKSRTVDSTENQRNVYQRRCFVLLTAIASLPGSKQPTALITTAFSVLTGNTESAHSMARLLTELAEAGYVTAHQRGYRKSTLWKITGLGKEALATGKTISPCRRLSSQTLATPSIGDDSHD